MKFIWLIICLGTTFPAFAHTLDDFSKKSENSWELQHGGNMKISTDFGINSNRIKTPGLRMNLAVKDFTNKAGYANWFLLKRKIRGDQSWKKYDGIRFGIAADQKKFQYLNLEMTTLNGQKFHRVVYPQYIGEKTEYRGILFLEFKNPKDPKIKLNPADIIEISISGSGNPGQLFLTNLELYKDGIRTGGLLKASTKSRFPNNTHDPGTEILLNLTPTGNLPENIASFLCRVNDYEGNSIFSKTIKREDVVKTNSFHLGKFPVGYYVLRIFPVTPEGVVSAVSCIHSEGSVPKGTLPFAITFRSVQENRANAQKHGMKSFFGFQNARDQYGINDVTGGGWKIEAPRWHDFERDAKPDRSSGIAPWAQKLLNEPKQPENLYSIMTLTPNFYNMIPKWARLPDDKTPPGWKNEQDYMDYVRDTVTVHKYRYSHMPQRFYEPTWEINFNQKQHHLRPIYTPEEIVDLYRRIAKTIKKTDPAAKILGPTTNVMIDWFEPLLKAGLLKELDGFSLHYYCLVPEESNIPETVAQLRTIMRKHIGKTLPLYITEAGYQSKVGGEDDAEEQARKLIRYSFITQGEGFSVYLMFFLHDVDPTFTWGVFYTCDPRPIFQPSSIAPKPVVPALSVATTLLSGAETVMNLRWFGENIWGYVSYINGKSVITLWHPYRKMKLRFPAGDVKSIKITGFMGKEKILPVIDGFAELEIGPDVCYIQGADPALYLGGIAERSHDGGVIPLEFFPGEQRKISIPASWKSISGIKSFGGVKISKQTSGTFEVAIPPDFSTGIVPLKLHGTGQNGKTAELVQYIRIQSPVTLCKNSVSRKGEELVYTAVLKNRLAKNITLSVNLKTPVQPQGESRSVSIPANREISLEFPIQKLSSDFNPMFPFSGELDLKCENETARIPVKVYFLSAYRDGVDSSEFFPFHDRAKVEGRGASGKTDKAEFFFRWSPEGLSIKISSTDDVLHQTNRSDRIWMEDSVQIAFDTDPESDFLYDEMTVRLSKKISQLAFALTPAGPLVWRHESFKREILPTGNMTEKIKCAITRNESAKKTDYSILIPWKEIGLQKEEIKKGRKLGIAILINDSDGSGTSRQTLQIYDGIKSSKSHKLYGILTIR